MNIKKLIFSPSPHCQSEETSQRIMWSVVIALLPALLVSILFFGVGAIKVTLCAVLIALLTEFLIAKYLLKQAMTISDGSALITGLLLAFNLPSNLPLWIVAIGSFVSIAIAKMSFGGLGKNLFNPALIGRVFLLISFPVQMTSWPIPQFLNFTFVDATTGPTVLSLIKEELKQGHSITEFLQKLPSYSELLMGQMGGSLGEVSALALLIGGLYLFIKKIITWHIPLSYLASFLLFVSLFYIIDPTKNISPLYHLLSGGFMLAVLFMATDMVTSPMTPKGQIIFGIGCGLLTGLIRLFGAYPEGVSFAILIMNAFVPLINKTCKPRRFGT